MAAAAAADPSVAVLPRHCSLVVPAKPGQVHFAAAWGDDEESQAERAQSASEVAGDC